MTNHHFEIPAGLIGQVRQARHIVALTGAGVSAESQVPTFREAQTGLWAQYNPEDLATPEAFQRDPALVWRWYSWRRELVSQAQPNPGHFALARLERLVPEFTLITQNVDGLHQRAGSQVVLELHGNISRVKCFDENRVIEGWEPELVDPEQIPPRCPRCAGYLRPDVVWFGEGLPQQALNAALQAARGCDVFFSIGTSGLVQPAASLAWLALEAGAVVVEINPNPTDLARSAAYALAAPSGVALPELLRRAWGETAPDELSELDEYEENG